MKFTIARNTLLKELAWLESAADRKTGIPILSYVLLEAKNDCLTLHVTDLEMTLTTCCEANIIFSGSICLPVRRGKYHILREHLPARASLVEAGEVAAVRNRRMLGG